MRIAVIADVHGNSWALEAVLAEIAARRCERLVNLGDTLYGPLDPAGTALRLMKRSVVSVSGNQDRALFDAAARGPSDPTMAAVLGALPAQAVAWVGGHPLTATIGDEVVAFHGTPKSDDSYLLERITRGRVELRPTAEIAAQLDKIRQPLVLCGHSHLPRTVALPEGHLVVNPGSVGLQAYLDEQPHVHVVENGSPHARFAVISDSDGSWKVEHVAVTYAWETAARRAETIGRKDWAEWLRTGRT